MRERDYLKDQTREALDVSALYKAVLASIAAEHPEPARQQRPVWLRACDNAIPGRRFENTDGHTSWTNTGFKHEIY